MAKRVFLIILDSVGVGEAPDAAAFGDEGGDTFGTCARSGLLDVPVLRRLGVFNIGGTSFRDPAPDVCGCFGRLTERSHGKDTTMGHWELAGMISHEALPTYPEGFPPEIIAALEEQTGRKVLCNRPYSGTEVIKDYGREQAETGALIVYTSADSVLQIAAHTGVIPLEELYEDCRIARKIMCGKHGVGRIIARPFIGEWPDYERTTDRHDFSLQPPRETILDALKANGLASIGVGKINDIFAGKGLTRTTPNEGNFKNMEKTIAIADEDWEGLCFVNLVDFDMIYGHRRDIPAYTAALNEVDTQLGELMGHLREEDLLILSADHGCDPGFKGTDHTREFVPCLLAGAPLKAGTDIGTRGTFADVAQTIAEYFDLDYRGDGTSFLKEILR